MPKLFFAAIACGLLSSWLIGQQWIAAGLLGVWLIRGWRLKAPPVFWLMIGLVSVMAIWLSWQNRQFQVSRQASPQTGTYTVTVQPDQIQVKGNQYQLVGTSREGAVIAYGRLTSPAAQQQLLALRQRTRWQVTGELSPVPPPTNPGQFDAPSYYRGQGIWRQLTIQSVAKVIPAPRTGWQGGIDQLHGWRRSFEIATRRLPPTVQLYAVSLLIGMRPSAFREQMTGVQQLGLLHLFSLSGMHVILLMGLLRWLLLRCRLSPVAVDYWLLGLLPLYLILGGGADSLQRAVITAWLPIVWRLITGRTQGALAGWSCALLIGIWLNPLVLLQLGGQLSYGLALLLILAPDWPAWRLGLWVQLISLPVILAATAQWHLFTLGINLLVAPLFSWVLLPLTLIGTSLGLVWPPIAQLCELGLANFQQVINGVATLPGLLTIGQPPASLSWGLGLMTLWLLRRPTQRLRRRLALAYAAVGLIIHFPLTGTVQFIDIGQGDSILLRQPFNRQVSLIDTGGRLKFPMPAWAQSSPARPRVTTITVAYLHQLGISHLDTVYLSHKDVDHIGDLGTLLTLMRVNRLVVPAGMAKLPKFQKLVAPARWRPQIIEAVAGQTFADGLTAVHPFQAGKAENEDSLVLTGRFGKQRFMFTGDLDRAGERAIVQRYPQLKVDVLKLGHHGSKTASDPQVLQQLGVRRGIISAGRHNRYGHPNAETLATLRQQRILTYSTAQQGMITYRYGGWSVPTWTTFLKEGNLYQRASSTQSH